jgi:hypothetical protein
VQVHLVWKTRDAVVAASGVPLQPTTTFAECPRDLIPFTCNQSAQAASTR